MMPEKTKAYRSPKGIAPKGHLALKSSALCTTDCKLVSQLLVQDHMAAHYKKLSKAKAAIDTAPPKTWSGSQKVRDQARRAAIKEGKSFFPTKKNNYTGVYSPMNTSRTSSDADREEMLAMLESLNDEDFPDGFLPKAGRGHKDESTLEVNARGSSVNISMDGMANMHTMARHKTNASKRGTFQRAKSVDTGTMGRSANANGTMRQPVSYSLDETSRGNVSKRGGVNTLQVTRGGDILECHTARFTERKPFTPKTLKTNSKSKLLEFKYYNRPSPKKDFDREPENELDIPKRALGRTMQYPRNRPVPKMTTESDLMNETLQSRADLQVTPTGVPPLNISLDPDHISWLQEQSKKSSSRRGYQSQADVGSDLESNYRSTNNAPGILRRAKSQNLKATLVGNDTITLDKVSESGEEDDLKYLEFVSDVTNDVLDRGIFTNRALLQVFEAHIEQNKGKLNVKRMYSMLEDLRTDLGIPSDKDAADDTFGNTLTYEKDNITKNADTEFTYNEQSMPSTSTHVTPLDEYPRDVNLNGYSDEHAFRPISESDRFSDAVGDNVKNTPLHSRRSSLKSRTPSVSAATSRKNSYQPDIDAPENTPPLKVSDVVSYDKVKKNLDATRKNSVDEEDICDEVYADSKAEFNGDNKMHNNDDHSNSKEEIVENYDSKYDNDDYEDDYEAETARTENDNDDYDTIRSNYEEIQKGIVSDRSEKDLFGQDQIESTTKMKAVVKSDNESDR